jgi:hypothetical protein
MTPPASNVVSRSVHDMYAEGLRYFMGQGDLHGTLAQLAYDLKREGIDYMVIGAVALLAYGYPRFTEDIDLVLTKDGLDTFHQNLIGVGYLPAFQGARKKLRSTRDGVSIEVLTSGEYPGDGKPKPVSFPVPAEASIEVEGVRIVTLEKLVELKLASGMTAPDRLKDLADVQELIKLRGLTSEFAEQLDPYVREQFLNLLRAVEQARLNSSEEHL